MACLSKDSKVGEGYKGAVVLLVIMIDCTTLATCFTFTVNLRLAPQLRCSTD